MPIQLAEAIGKVEAFEQIAGTDLAEALHLVLAEARVMNIIRQACAGDIIEDNEDE